MITKLSKDFQFKGCFLFLFFLAFDFCRFCVDIRFFHPRHKGFSIPDFPTRSQHYTTRLSRKRSR